MERPQLYLSPRVLHVRAAQMALRGRPSSLERHLRQSVLEPLARTWRRFSRQQQYTGILLIAMVLFGVVQFAHRSGWKQLTAEDTLCGRSIARVENGYGVTVLSLQRQQQHDKVVLPGPDLMLGAGDGLLVLATAPSLRRIELGQISPPVAELVSRCPSTIGQEARLQIRQTLARWLGCAPSDFNSWLDGGSHLTPPLDGEIRDLLHQDLRRLGVTCESLPVRFDPLPDEHH